MLAPKRAAFSALLPSLDTEPVYNVGNHSDLVS